MKNWNWLLIAWYLIPALGWASIFCFIKEYPIAIYLLYLTCIWIFVVIFWSLWVTRENDIKIMEDALINKEMEDD